MAAQMYGSSTTTTVAPPRVNLLPPEIAERANVRKAQVAMLGTGLAAVAVVGVLYLQATAKVNDAESDRAQATAANAALRSDLAKLDNVKETYARVDAANETLKTAMHYEVRWSTYLHDLTLRIPENVWLKEMEVKLNPAQTSTQAAQEIVLDPGIGTVSFKGSAFAHDDVAAWLETLTKQRGYADPYFTKSEDRGIPDIKIVDFESTVYLNEKALSKRYAKGLPR